MISSSTLISNTIKQLICSTSIMLTAFSVSTYSQANAEEQVHKLNTSLSIVEQTTQSGIGSQQRIDKLDDQSQQLLRDYREALQVVDNYKQNIEHLKVTKATQADRLKELSGQLSEVGRTETTIIPMLVDMVQSLESSISLSIPFHIEERRERIGSLKHHLKDPELSLPEKYRHVLDAYEIERDFGYTIEAYPEELGIGAKDSDVKVSILRIGRIALFYRSADNQHLGHWNRLTQEWEALPASYLSTIKSGIDMASERTTPSLLTLPVMKHQISRKEG